ncbi:NAD(+) diphosphatase [Steroidobacter sp.]|uniref:NAD(+) diphosphatase n=1 Tax=Steroidobacter sp. TaxID=1978227 RepID=UPI001A52A1CE|nr:NAD(+) diphosphatase [Steroidobacter sp.]MBL8272104.1 NAD(+) diphosphatase [Steroidobacter sp.]
MPSRSPNTLAGPYLERAAHRRKDEAHVQAALANPETLFLPVWQTRNSILRQGDLLAAHFVTGVRAFESVETGDFVLLGEFRGHAVFAVGLSGERPQMVDPAIDFQDLRMVAGALPAEEAGLLAYARAMVHWSETHRFCGRCGSPTQSADGGHVLRCSNEACRSQQFPRIDPAVIVLVTDGERALLGRQAAWPPGRYSTIAGFVEPGESLEDAVVREVREETGVEVEAVEYHSSQPWPFPSSLMLGFTAYTSRTDILQVDDELEDVRWWTRAEIAGGAVALPITHSISFRLVEDWYDSGAHRPLRQEPGVRMWQLPRR